MILFTGKFCFNFFFFFLSGETNKGILAFHWHFKNARNINICLDQRCHHSSIRTGILQSKSIQYNLHFPTNQDVLYKKLCQSCVEITTATSRHVSWEPSEWPGWAPIPRDLHSTTAVAPSPTTTTHLSHEPKSSTSAEAGKRFTLSKQGKRCATSPVFQKWTVNRKRKKNTDSITRQGYADGYAQYL